MIGFRTYLKRRHLNLLLAAQAEGRPTVCRDRQVWSRFEKIGDCRSRGDQVLERVEDDQYSAITETLTQGALHLASDRGESDGNRDQRKHHLGIVRVGQADEKCTAREIDLGCRRDLDGESRL